MLTFIFKRGKLVINQIIVASTDVWQSYFDHTFCKIHFMIFCCQLNFVEKLTYIDHYNVIIVIPEAKKNNLVLSGIFLVFDEYNEIKVSC